MLSFSARNNHKNQSLRNLLNEVYDLMNELGFQWNDGIKNITFIKIIHWLM